MDATRDKSIVVFDTVHAEELTQISIRRQNIYDAVPKPQEKEDPDAEKADKPKEDPDAEKADKPKEDPDAKEADKLAKKLRLRALDQHLAGLALSGGGIRSATFAIGLLQALSELELLTRFDYLSTVSGGGYAGSWLTAWLKRSGDVLGVQAQLNPSRVFQSRADRVEIGADRIVDDEPEPLHHLRQYSNYLAPWKGLMTADTWTLLAIYTRNTLINVFLLLPLTMILVLAAWSLVKGFAAGVSPDRAGPLAAFACFTLLLGVAFSLIGWQLAELHNARTKSKEALGSAEKMQLVMARMPVTVIIGILILAAVLGCWIFALNPLAPLNAPRTRLPDWFRCAGDRLDAPLRSTLTAGLNLGPIWISALEYGLAFGVLHTIANLFGTIFYVPTIIKGKSGQGDGRSMLPGFRYFLVLLGTSIVSGASGGVLFFTLVTWVLWPLAHQPWAIATVGPPLAILVFFVAVTVEVWLFGHWQDEDVREWWARVCAELLIAGVAWLGIMAILFYVPPLVRYLDRLARGTLTPAMVAGWLATSIGGALAGRSPRTGAPSDGNRLLDFLGRIAPPVFLVGLLATISVLVAALVDTGAVAPIDHRADVPLGEVVRAFGSRVVAPSWTSLIYLAVLSLIAAGIAWRFSDANLFSLHSLYGNRLVRCYLGASRPKRSWRERSATAADGRTFHRWESQFQTLWKETARPARAWLPGPGGAPTEVGADDHEPRKLKPALVRQENQVTGFDLNDDFPLRALSIGTDPVNGSPDGRPYSGPFPLINTTLNLVAGAELAWQDRKGESFTFTPLFCGSRDTWYRRLEESSDLYMTLGRVMAISGAAADPNMGVHQSAPLTALMTIFNARLGWWLQNPRLDGWVGRGPNLATSLVRELLGWTDERSYDIHLSDGGHFENLGAYELVRRRCRYIVISDAGMDPAYAFEDLARLIRLCRVDFGIRIEIDVEALRPTAAAAASRWHCAIGRIRYDDVDGGEIPGTLIYLKATITGDEPTDVQNYRALHPDFPHQTTADQFFNEDQFESYRVLGLHVGRTVFREAAHELRNVLWTEDQPDQEFIRGNRKLFSAVARRWVAAPPPREDFGSTADAWLQLQEALRDHAALGGLSRDIYPEVGMGWAAEGTRAELHTVAQMLQVMEDAWLRLGLGGPGQVPLNRGWMSVFRRWASTAALQRHWPTLRVEFSEDFIRFCEAQLGLGVVTEAIAVGATAWPDPTAERALVALGPEFAREWPDRSLRDVVEAARRSWTNLSARPPWLWVVVQGPTGTPRDRLPDQLPIGIVTAQDLRSRNFEFFAWLRRPYRAMGLGGRLADQLLKDSREKFWKRLRKAITIQVRFPARPRAAGAGNREEDMEFNVWRTFFSNLDFRARPRERIFQPDEDVVLQRNFDFQSS